jgi:sec-independent protein translocase protein TatA
MGTFSIWHWLIVLAVILLLFGGRGKISQLMGDFGKGLKSFKKSMKDDESFEDQPAVTPEPKVLPGDAAARAGDTAQQADRAARP